jgi:Beta-galactosidase
MAENHTLGIEDHVHVVSDQKAPSKRGWRDVAVLVLAVGLGFGAGALVRSSGASGRPPSGGSPPTAAAVSNNALGIFVFASPSTKTVSQVAASSFPGVQGYDWHVAWRDIEPSRGVFTFKTEDAAIAAAAAAGKSSQVAVISGEYEPAWVTAACPDMKVGTNNGDVSIAIPVTSCFAALLGQMIAAVGAHYNSNADVVSIQSDGLGVQGEMTMGTRLASGTYAALGITPTTLLAGWKRAITEWRTAAPRVPSSLAIEEPLGPKLPMLASLLTWVHKTYGADVFVQQNGLKAATGTGTGSLWADVKAATGWTTGGWQMFGSGSQNGNLKSAFHIGVAAQAAFVQVYVADVVNPADVAALKYVENAVSSSQPPPTVTPTVTQSPTVK